jgi:hypothetical protein
MPDEHRPDLPTGIEELLAGLAQLEQVFGEAARTVIPVVEQRLREAVAARDRGDPIETMRAIGSAMEELARLADRLDPQDAMLMRAVAQRFQGALLRGDLPEAKQGADVMFEQSGARYRKQE